MENLILEISKIEKKLQENIKDFDFLIRCFHFKYHFEVLKITSSDKRFVFEGQNDKNIFKVIVNRELVVSSDKIVAKKINQNEIDYFIVKQFMGDYNKRHRSYYKEYVDYYEYKFIFYQINEYNYSTYRIKKWFELFQQHEKLLTDPERLIFLQELFQFFKKFNKIQSETEKQFLWYSHYLKDKKFKFFNDYFKKDDLPTFGENLIALIKNDYYKKLVELFEKKLKTSVNQKEFIKSQIKENHELLKENKTFRYGREPSLT